MRSLGLFAGALALLAVAACTLPVVLGDDPPPVPQYYVNDGQPQYIAANNNLTFFAYALHSSSQEDDVASAVQPPDMYVAWTSMVASPPTVYPTIYASWLNQYANATWYDFVSTDGVLVIPGLSLVGEYIVYFGVDQSAFATEQAYTLTASLYNPVQLSVCPPRWQMAQTPQALSQYYSVTIPPQTSGQTVITAIVEDTTIALPSDYPLSLYVSTQPYPTRLDYMWTSNGTSIAIPASDPNWPPSGAFYIMVFGQEPTRYAIQVTASECPTKERISDAILPLQTCPPVAQKYTAPEQIGVLYSATMPNTQGDGVITVQQVEAAQAKSSASQVDRPFNSAIMLYASTSVNVSQSEYMWSSWNQSITIPRSAINWPADGTFYILLWPVVDVTYEIQATDSQCQPDRIALE